MNKLVNFLTTDEIIVVYLVVILACIISYIIYLLDKHSIKSRQKHNTRELNKLVEEVKHEIEYDDDDIDVNYDEPVLETLIVSDLEEDKYIETKEELKEVITDSAVIIKELDAEKNVDMLDGAEITDHWTIFDDPIDYNLEYTSIEPDSRTAQVELKKIEEELAKDKEEKDVSDIVTNYELQQEKTAIISLDELLKKGKEMYEGNESSQYLEEDAVINLQELETKVGRKSQVNLEDTFIMDDACGTANSIEDEDNKKFKNSPVISPVYGIEKDNYGKDKTSTSDFFMTLKELQERTK